MRNVLLAAGGYNILWGGFAVLFPNAMFRWLGMALPNYPQFWQCIGMIVGVYGIGYAIAAFDPARHWPIVLVGFLGKVFGPLGMAQALWNGDLPWAFAWNCLTNDLIWWVPFALILKYAWDQFLTEGGEVADEATVLRETRIPDGTSLAEFSRRHGALLVFLRHSGCTFCREAMADLAASRARIEAEGTRLVLVHLGNAESFAAFARDYGLGDVPAISDPGRRLYRAFGLRRGRLAQLFGWNVWRRGISAFFAGHSVGLLDGDGAQMPGVFFHPGWPGGQTLYPLRGVGTSRLRRSEPLGIHLMNTLLALHSAATWALVGLIWTIQLVHYPLFDQVGREAFRSYHQSHGRQITWIVAPLMFTELATAGGLIVLGFRNPWFLASLAPLVFNWVSTWRVQIPLHQQLGRGFDPKVHRRLVATNWWRTAAWTLRGACLLAMALA